MQLLSRQQEREETYSVSESTDFRMRRPDLSFLCETEDHTAPELDLLDEVYVRLNEGEECRGAGFWYGRVPRPVLYLIYELPSTAEFDVQKEAPIHSYVCRVTQFEINSAREVCGVCIETWTRLALDIGWHSRVR